jgi:hypothetical protein
LENLPHLKRGCLETCAFELIRWIDDANNRILSANKTGCRDRFSLGCRLENPWDKKTETLRQTQ